MPYDVRLYATNFAQRALAAKRRANYCCRHCGMRHGDWTLNRFGLPVRVQVGVAHLDHDVWNPGARLRVLCRRCHLRYDARDRRRKRWMMQIARGQLLLWQWEALRL